MDLNSFSKSVKSTLVSLDPINLNEHLIQWEKLFNSRWFKSFMLIDSTFMLTISECGCYLLTTLITQKLNNENDLLPPKFDYIYEGGSGDSILGICTLWSHVSGCVCLSTNCVTTLLQDLS